MRGIDGRLIANLNDNVPANITGSVNILVTSSIDENTTAYSLFPKRINAVPYISSSIYNTSSPQIKPIQYNEPGRQNLFVDDQGVVKVAVGTSFVLRLVAKQPPVLNIENGVPTMYSDQTKLTYVWQKDGGDILSLGLADFSRPSSSVVPTGSNGVDNSELVFTNMSPLFAGTYACIVSNDIGSTDSEQVIIEVYNPDIEDMFYRNVIDNPYGKDGIDGWSGDSELITNRLSDTNFKNFSQPWNTDLFGYSVDMFYPRPYHINTYHVKNSKFTQDIIQEGYYFTRERYKYSVKDGKAAIKASYDVDLTDIKDYIQGSIYGIDGVRGIFGCYVGNAVTRFNVTYLTALISKRNTKYSLLPNIARLDIANCLLAGLPSISEGMVITVQEFDQETPLLSVVNGVEQPGYKIYDPWTALLNNPVLSNAQASSQSPGGTDPDKIITAVQTIYPSASYAPTYGQYVQFNRYVIDKLNFKTNKIRITIDFGSSIDVINDTTQQCLDVSDECFEFVPWTWVAKSGKWPKSFVDYLYNPTTQRNWELDDYNRSYLNVTKDEPFKYATQLGFPRTMATGFNLVLMPLERLATNKVNYYTNTILAVKQQQTYPKLTVGTTPASQLTSFLSTLANYDYEVIGVLVRNRYNQPTSNTYENLGKQDISSRTTITTLKYIKNNPVQNPNIYDFNNNVRLGNRAGLNTVTGINAVWDVYAPYNDLSSITATTGSITVLYNSGSSNILNSNIPQLEGSIASKLIDYTNALILDVPTTFQTKSIDSQQFKSNYINQSLGIVLNLEAEKRGLLTSDLFVPTPSQSLKDKHIEDWKKLKDTTTVNFTYTLLRQIDNPAIPLSGYIPNTGSSQHIVYSRNAKSDWGSVMGSNSSTVYAQNQPVINIGYGSTTLVPGSGNIWYQGAFKDAFLARESYFEGIGPPANTFYPPGIYRYQSSFAQSSGPGISVSNGTYSANQQSDVVAVTQQNYANAIAGVAQQRANDAPNWSIPTDNGTFRDIRNLGSQTDAAVIINNVVIGSTGNTQPIYGHTVTQYIQGSTMDKVVLKEVLSADLYTPSAIVVPEQNKVYYFLYYYIDNDQNEIKPQ